MREEQESRCPNCEKLWEQIKKLEAEKEKWQKAQIVQIGLICVLFGIILVRLLITIATP